MAIVVQCSGCGGKFRAPDELASRRVKCPKCSAIIEVVARKTEPGQEPVKPPGERLPKPPASPQAIGPPPVPDVPPPTVAVPLERESARGRSPRAIPRALWALVVAAATLLVGTVGFLIHRGRPADDEGPTAPLRKVPLVVQWVVYPDTHEYARMHSKKKWEISDAERERHKAELEKSEREQSPPGRLDHAPDPVWDPSDMDVTTAILAATHAGRAAGYEFAPAEPVKKGQTPRDVIGRLDTNSDVVLLLRMRILAHRERPVNGTLGAARLAAALDLAETNWDIAGSEVSVLGDAALYRRPNLQVVFSAGFADSVELRDQDVPGDDGLRSEINVLSETNDSVKRNKGKMAMLARAFARAFDGAVVSRMQEAFQKEEIAREIIRLKQRDKPTAVTPKVAGTTQTAMKGIDRPPPGLRITRSNGGTDATAYLEQTEGGGIRKWVFSASQPVETWFEPGTYMIYAVLPSANNPRVKHIYRAELKAESNERYAVTIP